MLVLSQFSLVSLHGTASLDSAPEDEDEEDDGEEPQQSLVVGGGSRVFC